MYAESILANVCHHVVVCLMKYLKHPMYSDSISIQAPAASNCEEERERKRRRKEEKETRRYHGITPTHDDDVRDATLYSRLLLERADVTGMLPRHRPGFSPLPTAIRFSPYSRADI